jgi:hypothetical protein
VTGRHSPLNCYEAFMREAVIQKAGTVVLAGKDY